MDSAFLCDPEESMSSCKSTDANHVPVLKRAHSSTSKIQKRLHLQREGIPHSTFNLTKRAFVATSSSNIHPKKT